MTPYGQNAFQDHAVDAMVLGHKDLIGNRGLAHRWRAVTGESEKVRPPRGRRIDVTLRDL